VIEIPPGFDPNSDEFYIKASFSP